MLENFPDIVARLAGMVDRFSTTLDCVDTAFIADGILDQLPPPSQLGATRVGGVDLNKPRIRAALAAVLALAAAPDGFTVAEFTAKVHAMTGHDRLHHPPSRLRPAQTPRQAPRHQTRPDPPLPRTPGRGPHHRRPAHPARPRHRPHPRRRPQPPPRTQTRTWTRVDRDYETLRIDMQTLFRDLGIETPRAA